MKKRLRIHTCCIVLLLAGSLPALRAQGVVEIYADIKSSDSMSKLVTLLTDQLKKAVPASYVIKSPREYKGSGIYLDVVPNASHPVTAPVKLLRSNIEAYSINANDRTVVILGLCNAGVSHGVFSWLDFLGYRFYFPDKDWHIIPSQPRLFRSLSVVSEPSFYHRRIWYGYGTGSRIADADYNFWAQSNKLGGSMNAYFGHSYGNIISRNHDAFVKHPEWFYPKTPAGKALTGEEKFDVSNEELIQLLIKDAENQVEQSLKNKTQAYKMISLAPSDGVGTCNTPACQQLGTITDRVFYPVNRVAAAIRKKYPSTLVGCLAYGEYIAPPSKRVEPNVFVGITTAFNSSKYTTEQLVDEWRKKGAIVGIYTYFSWFAWDNDIPGQSHASRPADVTETIKKFAALGIKAYDCESSQGWISKGLGYYLAARQMWDTKSDAAPARKEFFRLCFQKAAPVMEKLWSEWENYSFKTIREGDLARWIDYAAAAGNMEKDEAVQKRLFQVNSYLHYLFLLRRYMDTRSENDLLTLLTYGYRKLDDGSVAGFPAFYELGNRSGIPGMAYGENAKWKTNAGPVKPEELDRLVKDDRRQLKINQPVQVFPVAAKLSTVPGLARYAKLTNGTGRWEDMGWWNTNEWVIQIKKAGADNYIDFSGHHLANTEVPPVHFRIYPYTPDGNVAAKKPVFTYDYTAVRVRQKISLATLAPGYYTVIIDDPGTAYVVNYSPAINFSQVVRPARIIRSTALFTAFIYVPEGVKYFNVMKSKTVGFITPTGRNVELSNNKPEDLQVEVLKGEAGLWRVKLYDEVYFEGIPPFISTSASQMLVPAGK